MPNNSDSKWFEKLPKNCPPDNAHYPNGKVVYRLVKNSSPSDKDFHSFRKLFPEKVFPNIDECTVCSVSVFDTIEEVLKIKKLPSHRKNDEFIAKFELQDFDGLVLHTFYPKRKGHFSWWRSKRFDINNCTIVDNA